MTISRSPEQLAAWMVKVCSRNGEVNDSDLAKLDEIESILEEMISAKEKLEQAKKQMTALQVQANQSKKQLMEQQLIYLEQGLSTRSNRQM